MTAKRSGGLRTRKGASSRSIEAVHARLPLFDQMLWHLDQPTGLVDFVIQTRRAAAFESRPGEQLTFWTLLAPDGELLTDRLILAGGSTVVARRTTSAAHILLIEVPGQDPFVLAVWSTESSGVVHLVSCVPASDGRWRRVERWVSNATAGAKVFLSDADFLRVGDRLCEIGSPGVSKLTARASDGSSMNRGFPSRRQPTLAEAVGMIDRSSQLRTVLMHVGDILSIHLRRLAGATYYSGDFQIFYDRVLREIQKTASSQRTLYSGRVRHLNAPAAPPVSIALPEGFFVDPERSAEFISALSSVAHLAVATVHRNPYLHLAVSDFIDGSTFDVFVTSEEEIDVHGGFTSSVEGFARLVTHISDFVPATDVREKEYVMVESLQELVALGG